MNEDWTDYLKIIVFLFLILGGLVFFGSCDSGWSIGSLDL